MCPIQVVKSLQILQDISACQPVCYLKIVATVILNIYLEPQDECS